ncbi:MAG: phosphoenolpyruvate carboxykinase (GTP), partial [Steroidobacteraceae bacterium]|nr:phosphoenolpyruvate carboxykinase (GTP) [Steroidobacteraceae bacterium]
DDIAWLPPGPDGRLYAINPAAGYFGVVPGTNQKTNRHAHDMIRHDTIFTNVAVTADNEPWWEGLESGTPTIDWKGNPYDPAHGPAAHPNSRFTVSAKQNPCYGTMADAPGGVPISAIVFGGRRRELAPLVFQARDWGHGVLIGAAMASETTAAATGNVGVVRRDPMAMKPFCGYNFGDYWAHWLSFDRRLPKLPQVFHVNWFRRNAEGKFLWPGYGENLRVLRWIIDRCENRAGAAETPIGYLPRPQDLDMTGLDISPKAVEELLSVNTEAWRTEMHEIGEYLRSFAPRTPPRILDEHADVARRLDW